MSPDLDIELNALTRDGIKSDSNYQQALAIMDKLIDNYDANLVLIEALSVVIENQEDDAEAFRCLRSQINQATTTLKVLMDSTL